MVIYCYLKVMHEQIIICLLCQTNLFAPSFTFKNLAMRNFLMNMNQ